MLIWLVHGGGFNNNNSGMFNFTNANEQGTAGVNVSFRLVICTMM